MDPTDQTDRFWYLRDRKVWAWTALAVVFLIVAIWCAVTQPEMAPQILHNSPIGR